MDSDDKADLDLAARVAQGDAGAFDDFYARHADLVFAFICHLLNGARADAEEIWQDTFVAALRALPGYRGQSRLSSWLCGIARHKVADFHRRSGGTREAVSSVPTEQLLDLMDSGPLPDEVLQQGAARARVVEALAGLPVDYRNALIARYVDGQPVDEVARRLGRSYKATESLLSRGRTALRDLLRSVPRETYE
jgi:RNA polymerase sigma-70 factor (ECF subfamily)